MSRLTERVAALEQQMAETAGRIADLAARLEVPETSTCPSSDDAPVDPTAKGAPTGTLTEPGKESPGNDTFWALEGLRQRLPDPAGAVLYTGVVEATPGERYEWQYGATTAGLLNEGDWSGPAGTLAALAHPVRLLLLREILGGRRHVADLAEAEGLGTSGQLYHHLRQLSAAGWLRSAGRGQYVVPPERVVPLLVILTAARH